VLVRVDLGEEFSRTDSSFEDWVMAAPSQLSMSPAVGAGFLHAPAHRDRTKRRIAITRFGEHEQVSKRHKPHALFVLLRAVSSDRALVFAPLSCATAVRIGIITRVVHVTRATQSSESPSGCPGFALR
jgi:hypothetical protein